MSDYSIPLLSTVLAAAVTDRVTEPYKFDPKSVRSLSLQAVFVRAAAGTSTDAWVQTSLDGGATWIDIAQFAFLITTLTKVSVIQRGIAVAPAIAPDDAALGADLIVDGLIGDRVRVKYTTVGTYTGASSLNIRAVVS